MRSILLAGVALALHLGAARAEDAVQAQEPVVASAVEASATETSPHQVQADAPAIESAPVQASRDEAPMGEAYATETAPALGTPPTAALQSAPAIPVAGAVVAPVPPVMPRAPGQANPAVAAPAAPVAAPVAALPASPVPLAVPQAAPAPKDIVEVPAAEYRRKLSGCIKTVSNPGCDKRELTKMDRDYLRYDRGSQTLSRDELEEVAEARMMQFDGAANVMMPKVEAPARPERTAAAPARDRHAKAKPAKVEPPVAQLPVPEAAKVGVQASAADKPVR